MDIKIRPIKALDVEGAEAVERECFPLPLKEEDFQNAVDSGVSFIAEFNGTVIAYILAETVLDECHIVRIAVTGHFRRKGVAQSLFDRLFDECGARKVSKFYLEVRASNAPSLNLYRKAGFSVVRIRKGYYADNNEDAIIMERSMA
jgi:ribosomal-protein-alanine N-acetyltransferase